MRDFRFISFLLVLVFSVLGFNSVSHAAAPVTWTTSKSLTYQYQGDAGKIERATAGKTSGKWYWEVKVDKEGAGTPSKWIIGITNSDYSTYMAYFGYSGEKLNYKTGRTKYGATYSVNDIVSVALDIDNHTIEWYKNGVSQGQSTYTAGDFPNATFAAIVNGSTSDTRAVTANFGASPFKYAIPAGYKAYDEENYVSPIGQSTLKATAGDSQVNLSWTPADQASSYTVKRSTTAGGPYTSIAKSVTANVYNQLAYTDTTAINGTTYYYTVSGVNNSSEGPASNEASATPVAAIKPNEQAILDVAIEKEKAKVGEEFTADLSLKNVNDIYAEDFVINYDSTLMQYLGYTEIAGYKVYNETNDNKGTLRFIVASQGKNHGISTDTLFLTLKFKAIAAGEGKVDSLTGRIADTKQEYDIKPANALQDTILIEKPSFLDVNRSGEYTLLDLSIDAFYFGLTAADTDKTLYDADQTEDNQVGDDDLVYIVNQMLANTNYNPHK
ncbi:cohesin domain-containing protein [Paenibacillus hunanensis]|uniref:cohesin domain-containing protein n=1 Tax=Paenibacillus hunanensis TaxID=539262 RepID=UPI002A6AC689|nr:cohesin domain-containing protein [Paenibacillus hunanensis]WPP40372.1 cohesin domain-containing protein [Paenibacillus hunanensis]